MNALFDVVDRHYAGGAGGIYSLCSAHPLVIRAALLHSLSHDTGPVLVEATCNQVNQDGGYTGMTPAGFRDFVHRIADQARYPRAALILGGDHLGPNPWQHCTAHEAMVRAETLVAAYVAEGFRKIHLDCSMACADDPSPLGDELIAERSARLCRAAESAWRSSGGEAPVYVIGTEVPVPGGATEELAGIVVTTPAAARATIDAHRAVFAAAGLHEAWSRVIAAVVQPGVEFGHDAVAAYVPASARALAGVATEYPRFVFEAHSTDYQAPAALAQLVRDHFAILKVGPAATFALREALWSLDAIEREWVEPSQAARLRSVTLECMRRDPKYWSRYYPTSEPQQSFHLDYSLSDRIRYYWNRPEVLAAQAKLFANLEQSPPPLPLISQYFPVEYDEVRSGRLVARPEALVVAHVGRLLDGYSQACRPAQVMRHA